MRNCVYGNSVPGTVFLKVTHLLEVAHTVPCGAHECGEQQVAQLSQTCGPQGRRGTLVGGSLPALLAMAGSLSGLRLLTAEWRPTAGGCVRSEDRALYPRAPALTGTPGESWEGPVIFPDSECNRIPICFFGSCT